MRTKDHINASWNPNTSDNTERIQLGLDTTDRNYVKMESSRNNSEKSSFTPHNFYATDSQREYNLLRKDILNDEKNITLVIEQGQLCNNFSPTQKSYLTNTSHIDLENSYISKVIEEFPSKSQNTYTPTRKNQNNALETTQKILSSSKKAYSNSHSPINKQPESDQNSKNSFIKGRRSSHEEQAFSPVAFKFKEKTMPQKKKICDSKLNIFVSFETVNLSDDAKKEDNKNFEAPKCSSKRSYNANEISNQKFSTEYFSPEKNSNTENGLIKFNSLRKCSNDKTSNFFDNVTKTELKTNENVTIVFNQNHNQKIPKHPNTQYDDTKKNSDDQIHSIPSNEFPTFRNIFTVIDSKKSEYIKSETELNLDSQCDTSDNKKREIFRKYDISENNSEDDYAILEEQMLSEKNLSQNDENFTKSEIMHKLSDNFITVCSNMVTEIGENHTSSMQLIDENTQNYQTENQKSSHRLQQNYKADHDIAKNYFSQSKLQYTNNTNASLENM